MRSVGGGILFYRAYIPNGIKRTYIFSQIHYIFYTSPESVKSFYLFYQPLPPPPLPDDPPPLLPELQLPPEDDLDAGSTRALLTDDVKERAKVDGRCDEVNGCRLLSYQSGV